MMLPQPALVTEQDTGVGVTRLGESVEARNRHFDARTLRHVGDVEVKSLVFQLQRSIPVGQNIISP